MKSNIWYPYRGFPTITRGYSKFMKNIPKLILFLLLVIIIGGSVFLATWDIPAPTADVKKVIPDDRFPR